MLLDFFGFWIPWWNSWSLCHINDHKWSQMYSCRVDFSHFNVARLVWPRCIDAVVILWIHRIRRHQRLSNAGLRTKVAQGNALNGIPLQDCQHVYQPYQSYQRPSSFVLMVSLLYSLEFELQAHIHCIGTVDVWLLLAAGWWHKKVLQRCIYIYSNLY